MAHAGSSALRLLVNDSFLRHRQAKTVDSTLHAHTEFYAQFLAVCSSSILAEPLGYAVSFSSPWRGKRRVVARRKPLLIDQLQPSTSSEKLSDEYCRRSGWGKGETLSMSRWGKGSFCWDWKSSKGEPLSHSLCSGGRRSCIQHAFLTQSRISYRRKSGGGGGGGPGGGGGIYGGR
jgi:hypothetical protein